MSNQVLVAGDFILDHHIYEGRRYHFANAVNPGVTVREELGGAALVHQLLCQLAPNLTPPRPLLLPSGWHSCQAVAEPTKIGLGHQSFALWRPSPGVKNEKFWRDAVPMGFGLTSPGPSDYEWPAASDMPTDPRILVLADGGMGFRKSAKCWNKLPITGAEWIVYKTEAPDFTGDLWKKIAAHRDKLIVVVAASELRKTTARISAGLSWEATLQDLYRELESGALRPLADAQAHLIVAFGVEGAIWIQPPSQNQNAHFIFDAPVVEGDRSNGTAFGLASCLTAGVVRALASSLGSVAPLDLVEGIEGGLSAMRDLLERGHGSADDGADPPHGFPADRLAEVICHPRYLFSRSQFPWNDTIATPAWSLLQQSAPDFIARARLVAVFGDIALQNVPHLQINNLFTADRNEIECLRTLVQTIHRYQKPELPGKKPLSYKPLSIGLFGPPGSGKSFAVDEIATQFFGKEAKLCFNLSQFKDENDLIGAFHQIRDRALQGIIPVAFFDEFDSQNLRWLQYLLAPMQDGCFQEGQITHPIGKCVFVFAGATSFTFETLKPAPDPDSGTETEAERHFRIAKGPDFTSRLDATLDVPGPNARPRLLTIAPAEFVPEEHTRAGTHFFEEDPDDQYKVIRRARMIRFELKVSPNAHLEIDPSLLDALLTVPRYTHGARSLGKIVQALKDGLADAVRVSSLPPAAQLRMHADLQPFLKPSEPPKAVRELPKREIDTVASAIHETYRNLGRQNGWLKKEDNVPFKRLPEPKNLMAPKFDPTAIKAWKKASNREGAKRMPRLLALAGLHLDAGKSGSTKDKIEVQVRIESLLDLLAKAEHTAWMDWHFQHGWKYNKNRKDEDKQHNQLLPYDNLDGANKNKDRSQVRHFPEFASRAAMKIVPG